MPCSPSTCQWRWKIVCPALGPTFDLHLVVVEAGVARGLRDELEHPLRLARRELADLAERVDVVLGDDEQVHLRLRVDVVDRDEALRLVRRRCPRGRCSQKRQSSRCDGKDPLLGDRVAPARGRARRRARRRGTASSRRRSRGPGGRRARRPRVPSFACQRRSSSSCESARSRAPRSFFSAGGTGSSCGGHGAGPRRVREDVHLRRARRARPCASVCANAASSSAGKPTITSLVRLNSPASGSRRRR